MAVCNVLTGVLFCGQRSGILRLVSVVTRYVCDLDVSFIIFLTYIDIAFCFERLISLKVFTNIKILKKEKKARNM